MAKGITRKKVIAKGSRSSGGGGGAVSSVNGATGAVTVDLNSVLSQSNDANGSQIINAADAVLPQDLTTLSQVQTLVNSIPTSSPIALDWADVQTETTAGNLIDGQLYNITNCPVFTSAVQLNDLRFYAYPDTGNSVNVLSPQGYANYSSVGIARPCIIEVDWYGSGQVVMINDVFNNNVIEGFQNIDIFPFGSGFNPVGNKVGKNFTLDITALTVESFNNNICYGNKSFTASAGRSYEGINFSKGYLSYIGTVSQSGATNAPTLNEQINELGYTITPSYNGPGDYRFDLTAGLGAVVTDCWLHIGNAVPALTADTYIFWVSDARFDINTQVFGAGQDDVLQDTTLEIRAFF